MMWAGASTWTVVGPVMALFVVSDVTGCSLKERVQRTGTVRYVKILDEVKPTTLYMRVGDG